MKKIIAIVAALVAFIPSAIAQKTVEQTYDYTGFKNLEINKNFEVKLLYAETYSVKIMVDERIAENIIALVKSNTLVLDIDEKSYSKELKKELKAKNAIAPVVMAEVYAPIYSKISLAGTSTVTSPENIKAEDLTVEVSNSAQVKNMSVDAQAVKVKLSNKASGRFDVYCNEFEYLASNSAAATLVLNCKNFIVSAENSSTTTADGEFKDLKIATKNSAVLNVTGTGNKVQVNGAGSSTSNLNSLAVDDAEVSLSNSAVCKINAKDHLKIELLNGSHCIFNGNPSIEVERIVGSSMTRSSDTKYNKNK